MSIQRERPSASKRTAFDTEVVVNYNPTRKKAVMFDNTKNKIKHVNALPTTRPLKKRRSTTSKPANSSRLTTQLETITPDYIQDIVFLFTSIVQFNESLQYQIKIITLDAVYTIPISVKYPGNFYELYKLLKKYVATDKFESLTFVVNESNSIVYSFDNFGNVVVSQIGTEIDKNIIFKSLITTIPNYISKASKATMVNEFRVQFIKHITYSNPSTIDLIYTNGYNNYGSKKWIRNGDTWNSSQKLDIVQYMIQRSTQPPFTKFLELRMSWRTSGQTIYYKWQSPHVVFKPMSEKYHYRLDRLHTTTPGLLEEYNSSLIPKCSGASLFCHLINNILTLYPYKIVFKYNNVLTPYVYTIKDEWTSDDLDQIETDFTNQRNPKINQVLIYLSKQTQRPSIILNNIGGNGDHQHMVNLIKRINETKYQSKNIDPLLLRFLDNSKKVVQYQKLPKFTLPRITRTRNQIVQGTQRKKPVLPPIRRPWRG